MKTLISPITLRLALGLATGHFLVLSTARLKAQDFILNGSFEDTAATFVGGPNAVMSLPVGSAAIPGWTTTDAELAWGANTNPFGLTSPYGALFLDLTGFHDGLPYGGVTQTIATTPNQSYQLSFALGANQDTAAYRGPVSVAVTVGGLTNSFTFTPNPPSTGNLWMTFTMDFVADSASTPVTLLGTAAGGGHYLGLDNVALAQQPNGPDLLTNGNFENVGATFVPGAEGVMSLPPGSSAIPGWGTVNAELAWGNNTNHFNIISPYGEMFLDLTGFHDGLPYAGVTQTAPTVAGQSYRLSFAVGADEDNPQYRGPMTVAAIAGSVSNTFTFALPGSGTQWGTMRMNFTATSPNTAITIQGASAVGGQFLGLDQVSVVPQPSGFRIAAIENLGHDLRLTFASVTGQNYAVQSTSDLVAGSWTTLPGTTTPGNGALLEITLSKALNQQRQFYRIQQLP